mgnify:CR=1 FL=1
MTDRPDIRAAVERRLKRRHAAERRFRLYGVLAITVAVAFLALLLGRIIEQGHSAFVTPSITLDVPVDPARGAGVAPGAPEELSIDPELAGLLLGERVRRVGGAEGGPQGPPVAASQVVALASAAVGEDRRAAGLVSHPCQAGGHAVTARSRIVRRAVGTIERSVTS